MSILSIGSVVRLNDGERKLMILNRAPLHNDNGTIGYFDYSACLFPEGLIDQQVYFFNTEDIAEVCFEGYVDENEENFRTVYNKKVMNITYPKLKVTN